MSTTHIRFRKRRTIISAALFAVGATVYLTQSGAPLRVHVVTVPMEFAITVVATYFLAATSLRAWQRIIGMIVGLSCVSVLMTWLSSKVIAALTPLDPWYFLMDLGATFLKATILVAVIWIVDFGFELVLTRRNSRESMFAIIVTSVLVIAAESCITVPAVVDEPQVISRGELVYPPELRQRGLEGLVKLQMMIGTDGVPRDIRVVHDDPAVPAVDRALEKFARDTVATWRFKPAMANGRPIERRFVTAIQLKLQTS